MKKDTIIKASIYGYSFWWLIVLVLVHLEFNTTLVVLVYSMAFLAFISLVLAVIIAMYSGCRLRKRIKKVSSPSWKRYIPFYWRQQLDNIIEHDDIAKNLYIKILWCVGIAFLVSLVIGAIMLPIICFSEKG